MSVGVDSVGRQEWEVEQGGPSSHGRLPKREPHGGESGSLPLGAP